MSVPAFDLDQIGKVMLALALGIPTGFERFKHDRSAGLRTFPLVSIASCAFLLATGSENADTQGRVLVGVMTGIGFIGGGSIIHDANSVHGTATAASLWNMGAVGALVAYGNYGLAVVMCAVNYLCLLLLPTVESKIKKDDNG